MTGSTNKVDKTRVEKLWKALAKYGIYTESQLNEAMKELQPLNIGIMVSPLNKKRDAV